MPRRRKGRAARRRGCPRRRRPRVARAGGGRSCPPLSPLVFAAHPPLSRGGPPRAPRAGRHRGEAEGQAEGGLRRARPHPQHRARDARQGAAEPGHEEGAAVRVSAARAAARGRRGAGRALPALHASRDFRPVRDRRLTVHAFCVLHVAPLLLPLRLQPRQPHHQSGGAEPRFPSARLRRGGRQSSCSGAHPWQYRVDGRPRQRRSFLRRHRIHYQRSARHLPLLVAWQDVRDPHPHPQLNLAGYAHRRRFHRDGVAFARRLGQRRRAWIL
mmetsp:Transcript_38098/g.123269  ORF Transcript_38098/g.123269 Transcript_38098/m.123269 type:complete len:271 (+) Transcript_38098:1440-2252(+)